jgi:hypothetical protein
MQPFEFSVVAFVLWVLTFVLWGDLVSELLSAVTQFFLAGARYLDALAEKEEEYFEDEEEEAKKEVE